MKKTIALLLLTGSLFGQVKLNQLAPAPTGSVMTIVTNSTTGVYTYTALGSVVTPTINGVYILPTHQIYFMGNSLTSAGVFPFVIDSLLGNEWTGFNKGLSGQTTTNMLARFVTDVTSNRYAEYVVIKGGTNDVSQLTSTTTITSNLQAMYTNAHNANIKVVAVTITPRTTTAAQLTIQQQVNAWIKTNAINIDYIVDPYVTMADPANPTVLLPAYTTDGVHMTNLGYHVLGTYIYNHATWIKRAETAILKVGAVSEINQNVSTTGDPLFNTVNGIFVSMGNNKDPASVAVGKGANNSSKAAALQNTGIGSQALYYDTTGYANTAVGALSMLSNSSANYNTAVGALSLYNNTVGTENTAIGFGSLFNNASGIYNTATGGHSLYNNTGSYNCAFGYNASFANLSAIQNTSVGYGATPSNQYGSGNTAVGYDALHSTLAGYNTAVGLSAGGKINTGTYNSYLGLNSGNIVGQKIDATNSSCIGYNSFNDKSNQVTLGNTNVIEVLINGSLSINQVGKGIQIKEGTNAKMGLATLLAGTVTVSNTSITANSRISLSIQSLGTVTVPMAIGVTTKTVGTSFVIVSSNITDTSIIFWEIKEAL